MSKEPEVALEARVLSAASRVNQWKWQMEVSCAASVSNFTNRKLRSPRRDCRVRNRRLDWQTCCQLQTIVQYMATIRRLSNMMRMRQKIRSREEFQAITLTMLSSLLSEKRRFTLTPNRQRQWTFYQRRFKTQSNLPLRLALPETI